MNSTPKKIVARSGRKRLPSFSPRLSKVLRRTTSNAYSMNRLTAVRHELQCTGTHEREHQEHGDGEESDEDEPIDLERRPCP